MIEIALTAFLAAAPQAAFNPDRTPQAGTRTYANARVVAIDAAGHRLTVHGGGVGKDEVFEVEPVALKTLGALKPGEEVILTLRVGATGQPDRVTRVERAGAGRPTTARTARRRRGTAAAPAAPTAAAPVTRVAAPPPAAPPSPSPSATGKRLPTDAVGPLHDPRSQPGANPNANPQRDPRVIPGLSEPIPTPTPAPTPTPRG